MWAIYHPKEGKHDFDFILPANGSHVLEFWDAAGTCSGSVTGAPYVLLVPSGYLT